MKRCLCLMLLAVLAAGLSAGCGGGGSSSSSTGGAVGIAGTAQDAAASGPSVATVAGAPIAKSSYEHWFAIERALDTSQSQTKRAMKRQVMSFLITAQWIVGEAAARHIEVSDAEVHKRLDELTKRQFPKAGSLQKYLTKAKESMGDLLGRVKLELLESKISAVASAGKHGAAAKKAALAAFQASFTRLWKSRTSCSAGYVMEDCKEYKGPPVAPASSGGTPSSSSRSSASGQTYNPPGGMIVASPEFERNGPIPAQHTCDGAGSSPPIEWERVPAHTAELFLFVIDDGSNGSDGGIRWVVGGIDPKSEGVAAGKLPAGGIVGRNTAGKVGYSPICPRKGQTRTIEIVLYALRKKIPLSTGFTPAIAESKYGKSIISSAVSYGVYHRG